MKLTPLEITQQTFPTRVNGYDRVAVQHYLAELGNTVEDLLRERQTLQQQLAAASTELNEKRQQEEEIRRVIVAAERIAHDMKENAIRESELLLAQAANQIQEMQKNQEVRNAQLEMEHQGRIASLEIAFRTRFTDLEREQHELTLRRERQHTERIGELEQQFSDRYLELQSRLNSARQEYTQFLNGYRALVNSFAELSQRHSLPDQSPLTVQPASNAARSQTEVATAFPSVNGQKFL